MHTVEELITRLKDRKPIAEEGKSVGQSFPITVSERNDILSLLSKHAVVEKTLRKIFDLTDCNDVTPSQALCTIADYAEELLSQQVVVESEIDFPAFITANKWWDSQTDDLDETSCPRRGAEYYNFISEADLTVAYKAWKESLRQQLSKEQGMGCMENHKQLKFPLPSEWIATFKEDWYKDNDRGFLPKKRVHELWQETERVCNMIYKYQRAAFENNKK